MSAENAVVNPSASGTPSSRPAILKLFGTGVIAWLLGSLVLFAVSWDGFKAENLPTAFMWTVSHWWMSYAFGLLVLIGYGLMARLPLKSALLAFVLPVAVLALIGALCLAVYPDSGFRVDLVTYLPLVILFYVLGVLWMKVCTGGAEKASFARAVIPSLVGGLTILGCVAVPVFAGDAFRYRDAFEFNITRTVLSGGEIRSEAVIEIRKPGHYEFTMPRYSLAELLSSVEFEPGMDVGRITWGPAGAPAAGAVGSFPLQIVWRKGILPPSLSELPTEENFVFLDVLDVADGNREIYYLTAEIKP